MSNAADSGPGGNNEAGASAFNPQVIAALVIAGLLGFIAFWVLSAFAPELSQGRNGGAHALSRSATSYSAIIELLRANGTAVDIARAADEETGLLILTPPVTVTEADLAERIAAHGSGPVLIVPPRWQTVPDDQKSGWVDRGGPLSPAPIIDRLPHDIALNVSNSAGGRLGNGMPLPDQVRTIGGNGLTPVIVAANGQSIVARVTRQPQVMILADADLIANHGVATAERAQTAVALIAEIAPGQPVIFDVTLNGFGATRSLLRLAFTPPFLGLTLCLLMAGLLALLAGFVRFGPPLRELRAVAFGKAALVANSARLIVQAQRVQHFAGTYVDQVRQSVARRMHAPANLSGRELDAWLDRFADARQQRFSGLAAALTAASSGSEAVVRARALGQWRKDIMRGNH